MAYKVIILYQLYMPSYFLGTFTEYPYLYQHLAGDRGGSGTTCSRILSLLLAVWLFWRTEKRMGKAPSFV